MQTSSVASHEFLANRRIVLFSVPAAFSPTCSEKHLPGFIEHAGSIKSKGVATIVCMSVNDSWVMSEWAKSTKVGTDIVMLADGNAAVAKSLGLAFDAGQIGIRARRFAMVIDNGVVKHLFVDDKGKFVVSGADTIMSAL
jgi:peroxiredoxin